MRFRGEDGGERHVTAQCRRSGVPYGEGADLAPVRDDGAALVVAAARRRGLPVAGRFRARDLAAMRERRHVLQVAVLRTLDVPPGRRVDQVE